MPTTHLKNACSICTIQIHWCGLNLSSHFLNLILNREKLSGKEKLIATRATQSPSKLQTQLLL